MAFSLSTANVENDETTNIFASKGGNTITRQNIDEFKINQDLPMDLDITLQEISEQNTFRHNGKVYSLRGEPLDVFSSGATYMHNGIPEAIPATNMLIIEDADDIVTIRETALGEVDTVMITNKRSGDSDFLHSVAPKVLASVENENNDAADNLEQRGMHLRRRVSQILNENAPTKKLNTCLSYRQIDLAVAYDSSFCADFGGSKDASDKEVFSIVSMVSSKYQQEGLCIKVKLSHLEGYCSPHTDPYKMYVDTKTPGCYHNNLGEGVLGGLRKIWVDERTQVHRDVVQLFIGETVDSSENCVKYGSCVRGCAQAKYSTCTPDFGYAFSQVTYSRKLGKRVTVVAHELGHNNGAGHYGDTGHVMYPTVQEFTEHGFSMNSINDMNFHFSQTSCIGDETASFFPTMSPTHIDDITSSDNDASPGTGQGTDGGCRGETLTC